MLNTQEKKVIGKRLKELRCKKRLTQVRLKMELEETFKDKDIHLSTTTLSNYETGDRLPDIEILMCLSQFYNLSIDYLLYGTKEDIDTSIRKIVKFCSYKDAKNVSNILSSLATAFENLSE